MDIRKKMIILISRGFEGQASGLWKLGGKVRGSDSAITVKIKSYPWNNVSILFYSYYRVRPHIFFKILLYECFFKNYPEYAPVSE